MGQPGHQNRPVLFISYFASELDEAMRQLAEDLRKRGIQALAWPRDTDPNNERLVRELSLHRTSTRLVLIALEPGAAGRRERRFTAAVQALARRVSESVSEIMLVSASGENSVPVPLQEYQILDASSVEAIEQFALNLGGGMPPPPGTSTESTGSVVSGIFEIARSQSEMFAELKQEIKDGAINQKYLYWDVRASLRWQRIAELSTYLTAQSSMNLLVAHAAEMLGGIVDSSNSSNYSFINFGVGTGVKDYHILSQLLTYEDSQLLYVPVDESLSMIQITIQSLQELIARYSNRLRINFVLDDFANTHRFQQYIEDEEKQRFKAAPRTRVLALLGGSVGNFREDMVLKNLLSLMKSPSDRLILGVEFLGDRTDHELAANYADMRMREFLYGPILDAEGISPDWDRDFHNEIRLDRSVIPGARTIVGSVHFNRSHFVELFQSTKYVREELERYLAGMGLDIVDRYFSEDVPVRFGKYVLRRRPSRGRRSS